MGCVGPYFLPTFRLSCTANGLKLAGRRAKALQGSASKFLTRLGLSCYRPVPQRGGTAIVTENNAPRSTAGTESPLVATVLVHRPFSINWARQESLHPRVWERNPETLVLNPSTPKQQAIPHEFGDSG